MNIFQGVFWIIIHVRNSVRNSVPSNNTQLYFFNIYGFTPFSNAAESPFLIP